MIIGSDINLIAKYLNLGKVVALPTETVYGLAVKYDIKDAINKMSKIKKREKEKTYTMMLADKEDISKYVLVNSISQELINLYMPGEITIIMPKNPSFENEYFNDYDFIGIRIPNHELMLGILKITGPLLVSSANTSGNKPCVTSDEVSNQVNADIIVQGASNNNKPSTIVKITNKIEILRQGDLKL